MLFRKKFHSSQQKRTRHAYWNFSLKVGRGLISKRVFFESIWPFCKLSVPLPICSDEYRFCAILSFLRTWIMQKSRLASVQGKFFFQVAQEMFFTLNYLFPYSFVSRQTKMNFSMRQINSKLQSLGLSEAK